MENMEEKIMDVLGDPAKMEQIMSIAKGLGFSPEQEEQEQPNAGALLSLLQQTGEDGRQDALFQALMPYLRPGRRKKLQQAMKIAKLSHLAGFALKNYVDEV